MPCNSNADLPPQVRSSLSDADQSKWREVYNSALEQYGDQETAAKVAWAAVQKSENCRSFGGWISVEKIDSQGDKVDIDALYEAVKKYIARGGPIMDEHTNRPIGTMYDAQIAEYSKGVRGIYGYGAVFQDERFYDKAWEAIKSEKHAGLSIGGDAVEEKTVCDSKKCWNEISKMHIFEVSTCKRPANHDSLITDINEKAKSETAKEINLPDKTKTDGLVTKVDCNNECMKRYQNSDGTFKGGFDGCVKAFQECCSGVSDASALCAHIGRETGKIPKGTIGLLNEYLTKHPDGGELTETCPHCKEIYDSLKKSNLPDSLAKDATLAIIKTIVKQEGEQQSPPAEEPKPNVLEEVMMKMLSIVTDSHKLIEQFVTMNKAPEVAPPVEPEPKQPEEKPAGAEGENLPKEQKKMQKSEDVKKLDVAPAPTSAPATEQPTAPPPPAPPAPPKIVVETPKPAPVPGGGQGNELSELLKDPQKLRKMSYKQLDKLIGRTK